VDPDSGFPGSVLDERGLVGVVVTAVRPPYPPDYSYRLPRPMKSTPLAYLWCVLLGIVGVHQFYMGKTGRGVLYLLTGGVVGFGVIWDLFTLPAQLRQVNAQIVAGVR
jgi:TM2 domain-containing membrane protein YozV